MPYIIEYRMRTEGRWIKWLACSRNNFRGTHACPVYAETLIREQCRPMWSAPMYEWRTRYVPRGES